MTAYLLVVIFVATLIRSMFGFSEALIAVPLLALLLPVNLAAPLAGLVSDRKRRCRPVVDWRHAQMPQRNPSHVVCAGRAYEMSSPPLAI